MQTINQPAIAVIESKTKDNDLMINYKIDDTMSSSHMFFRDYTGTFFSIILLVLLYFAMVIPPSWMLWLSDLFQLHGMIEVDGHIMFIKSIKDILTVLTLASILLVLRYFLSHTLFSLIARWMGIKNSIEQPHIEHKCREQAWLVLYYTFSFSAGVTIIRKYIGFTLNNVWLDYPQIAYPWDFKMFYLTQCAFYVMAIIVTLIEKHRKDIYEMLFHHVVTISLITTSYYTNFTRIGVVVFVIFDAADALLPLAKIFQYAFWKTIGYTVFALFTIIWIITRHYMIIAVMINIIRDAAVFLPVIWDPSNGYYVSLRMTQPIFITFFTLLEILQVFWLINILKLIYRQVFLGQTIGDDRSCREDEDIGEEVKSK